MRQEIIKEARLEKINILEIDGILKELKTRDESNKGCKPELVLGCFRSLNISDNSECVKCKFYISVCEGYLKVHFKE